MTFFSLDREREGTPLEALDLKNNDDDNVRNHFEIEAEQEEINEDEEETSGYIMISRYAIKCNGFLLFRSYGVYQQNT